MSETDAKYICLRDPVLIYTFISKYNNACCIKVRNIVTLDVNMVSFKLTYVAIIDCHLTANELNRESMGVT